MTTKKKRIISKRKIGGQVYYNPKALVDPPTYRSALTQVNRFLKKLGRKPITQFPMGIRGDAYSCPIGRVLNARMDKPLYSVQGECIYDEKDGGIAPAYLSDEIADFTQQFDMGDII